MTAREIQRALMFDLHRRGTVCPNFTPKNWWECDVFEITEAAYFREYEIKLSMADFKADAKKQEIKREWVQQGSLFTNKTTPGATKHQQLTMEGAGGPNHFYFVTPIDLLSIEIIPQFAGWIEVAPRAGHYRPPWNISIFRRKEAPRLHRNKIDPEVRDQVKKTFYYRFMNLFLFEGGNPAGPIVEGTPIPEPLNQ